MMVVVASLGRDVACTALGRALAGRSCDVVLLRLRAEYVCRWSEDVQ